MTSHDGDKVKGEFISRMVRMGRGMEQKDKIGKRVKILDRKEKKVSANQMRFTTAECETVKLSIKNYIPYNQ